jgi:GT2 family glycosyltransferase
LDDDTVLEQGALLGMVSYISSHPEIGLIAPRVVFSDNLEQTAHCANFVDSCTGICREKDTKIPISCDWLISICCLARREALNRSGGFYSGYYTCYEEVELGLRIKKAGYRVVYYPGSKVRHLEKQMQFKRERLYYLYRNKIILVRRNFVFLNQVSSLLFVIIFGLPRYLLESIVFNRGICWTEIRLIFLAVRHGLIGKTGKLGELSQ